MERVAPTTDEKLDLLARAMEILCADEERSIADAIKEAASDVLSERFGLLKEEAANVQD